MIRLLVLTILFPLAVFAADFSPARPIPERLVNNLSKQFPDLLSPDEETRLESKLVDFDNKSSNQIAIVIIDSLQGREVNEFSTALFNKWGIGQKKNNNGVLILIKPTTTEGGRKIYISTGYGLEAVLPDITCKRIIEEDLTPNFKRGYYYTGLDQATSNLMALSVEEFNTRNSTAHLAKNAKEALNLFFFALMVIVGSTAYLFLRLVAIPRMPYTIASNNAKSNSIGGFSSGGGFSGGGFSGGGFGGFGGGFSGGGGAGGSW